MYKPQEAFAAASSRVEDGVTQAMVDGMKNIQVIDGAMNCYYPIYSATDEEFRQIFPDEGQDTEFIEDLLERLGDDGVVALMTPIWERECDKKQVVGIHGTMFYELAYKKQFYPTKIESEMTYGDRGYGVDDPDEEGEPDQVTP